jgi:hypothetical protein
MSMANLRKLWLILSVILLVFTLSAHGQTQGADFELKINALVGLVFPEKTDRVIISLWGVILTSILLMMVLPVMTEHAQREGNNWKQRFPFRMWDEDPAIGLAAKAQAIAFLVFVLWPLFTLGHFWRILYRYGMLCTRNGTSVKIPDVSVFDLPPDWKASQMFVERYHLAGETCEKSTAYFPLLQPMIMVILTITVLWFLGRAIYAVFLAPGFVGNASPAVVQVNVE